MDWLDDPAPEAPKLKNTFGSKAKSSASNAAVASSTAAAVKKQVNPSFVKAVPSVGFANENVFEEAVSHKGRAAKKSAVLTSAAGGSGVVINGLQAASSAASSATGELLKETSIGNQTTPFNSTSGANDKASLSGAAAKRPAARARASAPAPWPLATPASSGALTHRNTPTVMDDDDDEIRLERLPSSGATSRSILAGLAPGVGVGAMHTPPSALQQSAGGGGHGAAAAGRKRRNVLKDSLAQVQKEQQAAASSAGGKSKSGGSAGRAARAQARAAAASAQPAPGAPAAKAAPAGATLGARPGSGTLAGLATGRGPLTFASPSSRPMPAPLLPVGPRVQAEEEEEVIVLEDSSSSGESGDDGPSPLQPGGAAGKVVHAALQDALGKAGILSAAHKRMSLLPMGGPATAAGGGPGMPSRMSMIGGGRMSLFPGQVVGLSRGVGSGSSRLSGVGCFAPLASARAGGSGADRRGALGVVHGGSSARDSGAGGEDGGRRGVGGGRRAPLLPPMPPTPIRLEEEEEEEVEEVVSVPPPLTFTSPSSPSPSQSSVAPGLAMVLGEVLDFLPHAELHASAARVSTAWRAAAAHSSAWRVVSGLGPLMEARAGGGASSRKGKKGGSKSRQQQAQAQVAPLPAEPRILRSLYPMLSAFPWGRFLSAGAYKQVYAVWSAARGRLEAVSVMDARALHASGNLPVVAAEVQCAVLLSGLVRQGVCPHFVETHAAWLHAGAPGVGAWPGAHWGAPPTGEGEGALRPVPPSNPFTPAMRSVAAAEASAGAGVAGRKVAAPSSKGKQQLPPDLAPVVDRLRALAALPPPTLPAPRQAGREPLHVFIRMELCGGGDAEEWLRRVEPAVARAEEEACGTSGLEGAMAAVSLTPAAGSSSKGGKGGAAAVAHLQALDAAAAHSARDLLFQMAMSLYCCRERLGMRHHDVKLLNFFLCEPGAVAEGVAARLPPSSATTTAARATTSLVLRYCLGQQVYALQLPLAASSSSTPAHVGAAWVAKLADYGTAAMDPPGAAPAQPIGPHHFATLENSPPEYLLYGDACLQGFSSDSWALGLCGLHLLTGRAPWEEWMEGAVCPPGLRAALGGVWRGAAGYSCVATLLEADEEEEEREAGPGASSRTLRILADTLWRQAVLLGLGQGRGVGTSEWWDEGLEGLEAAGPCPIVRLLTAVAAPAPPAKPARAGAGAAVPGLQGGLTWAALQEARAAFVRDCAVYCVHGGSHPLIQRVWRRAGAAPGLLSAVRNLLSWQRGARATMLQLLTQATAFQPLRKGDNAIEDEESEVAASGAAVPCGPSCAAWREGGASGAVVLSYAFYDRRGEEEEEGAGSLRNV